MPKIKTSGKILGLFIITTIVVGGYFFAKSNGWLGKPSSSEPFENYGVSGSSKNKVISEDNILKVAGVTWPGYNGLILMNNGFEATENCQLFQDYGIQVEYSIIDEFDICRNAWKADQVDIMWGTVDAFATEASSLIDFDPVIFFVADKSRGGDLLLTSKEITSLNQLKGKRVSFAVGQPSHTLLFWALETAGLGFKDIQKVEVGSAPASAEMFKSKNVDAAVLWSPDEVPILKEMNAHVLLDTKKASELIADCFIIKRKTLDEKFKLVTAMTEGWLRGNATLNTNKSARDKVCKLMAENTSQPESFWQEVFTNVRYLTYGDNMNFFGIGSTGYKGLTGRELYTKMIKKYSSYDPPLAGFNTPGWERISTTSVLKAISLSGTENMAEAGRVFEQRTPDQVRSAPILSRKSVTVNFAVNSAILDGYNRNIIKNEFGDILRAYPNLRVRLSGNTDNTGNYTANVALSRSRARAVSEYLAAEFGLPYSRFVVDGYGPDNPIASNATPEGRAANRRTDLEFIID